MARLDYRVRGHDDLFARPLILLGIVLLLTGSVTGCTGKHFDAIRPGLETRGCYIEGVPFYRQSKSTSVPAAFPSVLAFYGRRESLGRIDENNYSSDPHGTLPMNMEDYAREAGFKTTAIFGAIGELKAYIRKGTPVICMLDLGLGPYHQTHYVSVIGFDDENKVFIVHDGSTPNSLIGYEKFNKEWVRASYWMLVVEPRAGDKRNEQ